MAPVVTWLSLALLFSAVARGMERILSLAPLRSPSVRRLWPLMIGGVYTLLLALGERDSASILLIFGGWPAAWARIVWFGVRTLAATVIPFLTSDLRHALYYPLYGPGADALLIALQVTFWRIRMHDLHQPESPRLYLAGDRQARIPVLGLDS